MISLTNCRVCPQVTVLKQSLTELKEGSKVKDRWQAWLNDEKGLKPLQEEIPAYFADDVWDRFNATVSMNLSNINMVWSQ